MNTKIKKKPKVRYFWPLNVKSQTREKLMKIKQTLSKRHDYEVLDQVLSEFYLAPEGKKIIKELELLLDFAREMQADARMQDGNRQYAEGQLLGFTCMADQLEKIIGKYRKPIAEEEPEPSLTKRVLKR